MKQWELTLRLVSDPARVRRISVEAPGRAEAGAMAEGTYEGWVVTKIVEVGDAATRQSKKPVSGKALVRLCRGLGSMIEAGVSLEDALKFYSQGVAEKELLPVLRVVESKLAAGESIRDAFAATGRFDEVFLGMVRAGSESGLLGGAFKSIAARKESESRFRSRLLRSMLTPTGVILFLIGVFITSQIVIIPQVEKMLRDVGQEPDFISGIIFQVAALTRTLWPFAMAGTVALGVAFIFNRDWRKQAMRILGRCWPTLRIMVGGFRQMLFLGVLEMLTRSGISVEDALKVCMQTLGRSPLGSQLPAALRLYQTGLPLSQALARETECDPVLCHLVGVGEMSGTLDEQLGLLVRLYEEQTADAMDVFVQTVSLGTIVSAICLIGFVFVGTYLPIVLIGPRMMQSGL